MSSIYCILLNNIGLINTFSRPSWNYKVMINLSNLHRPMFETFIWGNFLNSSKCAREISEMLDSCSSLSTKYASWYFVWASTDWWILQSLEHISIKLCFRKSPILRDFGHIMFYHYQVETFRGLASKYIIWFWPSIETTKTWNTIIYCKHFRD